MQIKNFFDPDTATFTYIISCPKTGHAAIIDSVLNYDQFSGRTTTNSANQVIQYTKENQLKLQWILETHIHADHLTASQYIKEQLGGKIGVGSQITKVLETWIPIFNIAKDTPLNASQFDQLFDDNAIFKLGELSVKVLHTPGHTPACVCYFIEDCLFVGDLIFMPDVGTARTDFPGGSAETMYTSLQRILLLPNETKIFTCHDYPTKGREVAYQTTIGEEKKNNILINQTISKEQFLELREKRNNSSVPKLMFPAVQFNLRAGSFGEAENNGVNYIKIPVNKI